MANDVLEAGEILKDDNADKTLKQELGNLAKDINVKESSSDKVDALFAKLDGVDEDAKNRALQYALKDAKITVGNIEKSIADIAEIFGKAVEQDWSTWKIKLKADASNDDKEFVGWFLNEKWSSLAYLIQLSSQKASLQASRWYWRSNADWVIDVADDKIFWNQTRRALSWLKEWIQWDYTKDVESMDVKTLKVEDILEMKFISKTLKEKIESESEDEAVKNLWKNENYELKNRYTNNFALKQKWVDAWEGDVESKVDDIKTGNDVENGLDWLQKKYGCRIEERDEDWNKVYKVKKWSEQFSFTYQKDEKTFSFLSGWWSSFSIDVWGEEDEKSAYETALDKSVKIAAEIANIMTKAKNNTLDLEHFELSSNDKDLQADYKWRIFDFWSWTPIKIWKANYSWVWDVSLLNDIEWTLWVDPSTFCNFMNECYENQKWKTAKDKWEVEITSKDGKHFEVESHWQKISFLKRWENTFVFKTKQWTELVIQWDEEYASHAAAVINYIVSIVKNSWEKLEYFEKDWDAIQADYDMRYFDVDLLSNVKETIWVSATTFTTFMNSYRKDVGI